MGGRGHYATQIEENLSKTLQGNLRNTGLSTARRLQAVEGIRPSKKLKQNVVGKPKRRDSEHCAVWAAEVIRPPELLRNEGLQWRDSIKGCNSSIQWQNSMTQISEEIQWKESMNERNEIIQWKVTQKKAPMQGFTKRIPWKDSMSRSNEIFQ